MALIDLENRDKSMPAWVLETIDLLQEKMMMTTKMMRMKKMKTMKIWMILMMIPWKREKMVKLNPICHQVVCVVNEVPEVGFRPRV